MRLVFAGTPQFAAVSLRSLLRCGHIVTLVLTQPDRPAGRGQKAAMSTVKAVAVAHDIAVQQPPTLKDPAVQQRLAQVSADAWVVAAYGLILPRPVLDLPPLGCLNIHASLLPRWRGAAPIQRALLAGDRETGISIMRMDEGLDTGPVYLRVPTPIAPTDTGGSLHDRLAEMGAAAICKALQQLGGGTLHSEVQPADGACYAPKLQRADCQVDWSRPAGEVERLLRALDPAPGAYTVYDGQNLKLWRATLAAGRLGASPGTILAASPAGIEVQCADASVLVTELQRPGGRRMRAADFVRGFALTPGLQLGTAVARC